MSADRWARRASTVLLVVCGLLVSLTLVGVWVATNDRTGATGYQVGDVVDLPAEWYETGENTLLVFFRSDCVASQALAGRLPEFRRQLTGAVRLFAVISDSPEEMAFAETAGFDRAAIRTVDLATLRLRVVPTVVLVGRDGRVKLEEVAASADSELRILSTVSRLASES